jgi:hypothetical protein
MILALERWLSTKEDVHDDSTAPHITLLIVHAVEDLWCYIVRRSEFVPHFCIGVENYRGPEVYDLYEVYLIIFHQKEVLRLQVSVDYLPVVTVHHGRK